MIQVWTVDGTTFDIFVSLTVFPIFSFLPVVVWSALDTSSHWSCELQQQQQMPYLASTSIKHEKEQRVRAKPGFLKDIERPLHGVRKASGQTQLLRETGET